MVNTKKLKGVLVEHGFSQQSLAKEMNLSKNTLNSRINGRSEFSTEEVKTICRLLYLSQEQMLDIFFT